jgi:hypothetical protein
MFARFARVVALLLGFAATLTSHACFADEHPGFYFRLTGGPSIRLWGYGVATPGGEGAVAFGWAVGPSTAIAAEAGLRYGKFVGETSPNVLLFEEFGLHLEILGDHYFDGGTRGLHALLGGGAGIVAFTGGTINYSGVTAPDASGQSQGFTGQTPGSGPWFPFGCAGLGYDWGAVGVLFRAEVGVAGSSVPVRFSALVSLRSF